MKILSWKIFFSPRGLGNSIFGRVIKLNRLIRTLFISLINFIKQKKRIYVLKLIQYLPWSSKRSTWKNIFGTAASCLRSLSNCDKYSGASIEVKSVWIVDGDNLYFETSLLNILFFFSSSYYSRWSWIYLIIIMISHQLCRYRRH